MRAVLINAQDRTVTNVDIKAGDLEAIYELLNCRAFDVVYIGVSDCLYIDDEGLFTNPEHFFTMPGFEHPLAGNGLIVGTDLEGDTVEPAADTSVEVTFLARSEVLRESNNTAEGN